jgi:hypothetical protein
MPHDKKSQDIYQIRVGDERMQQLVFVDNRENPTLVKVTDFSEIIKDNTAVYMPINPETGFALEYVGPLSRKNDRIENGVYGSSEWADGKLFAISGYD